jgi:hypothetical protein
MIEIVEEALSTLIELHDEGGDVISCPSNVEDPSLPPWMPPTVDLFVQDSIFRATSDRNLTGIESAQLKFRKLCLRETGRPVAWGNTNTRPREYKYALQVAEESKRPVHFVTFFDDSAQSVFENRDGWRVEFDEDVFALRGDLKELLRRNVERFLKTGRFIPSQVIHAMSERSQNLAKMVADHWRQELASRYLRGRASTDGGLVPSGDVLALKRISKFEFDRVLARLANFEMNANRTVAHLHPPRQRKSYYEETNGTRFRFPQQPSRQQYIRPRSPASSVDGMSGSMARPWDKKPRQVRPRPDRPLPVGIRSRPEHSRADLYPNSPPHIVPAARTAVFSGNATSPRIDRRGERNL